MVFTVCYFICILHNSKSNRKAMNTNWQSNSEFEFECLQWLSENIGTVVKPNDSTSC